MTEGRQPQVFYVTYFPEWNILNRELVHCFNIIFSYSSSFTKERSSFGHWSGTNTVASGSGVSGSDWFVVGVS